MSIKKSLRLTILLLTIMPFVVAFIATHWLLSTRLLTEVQNRLLYTIENNVINLEAMLRDNTITKNENNLFTSSEIKEYSLNLKTEDNISVILASINQSITLQKSQSFNETFINNLIIKLFDSYEQGDISVNDMQTVKDDNAKYFYAYRFLPKHNLILLAIQPIGSIHLFSHTTILIFSCLLLIVFSIAFLILHHFTRIYTKPLIDLRNVIRLVSNGDLNVHSNYKGSNEIGELSRSFNKMIYMIKNNYDELSAMHEKLVLNEDQLRTNYSRIEYLAYHDVLTNLPNKMSFHEHVDNILTASSLYMDKHGIFFIDLDNFKIINDTLGHEYGDLLLIQTATRLESLCLDMDCVARTGGDEFLFFKANVPSNEFIQEFGQKILNLFKTPFQLREETAYISLSIGVSIYPENGFESYSLIKNADIAMYSSKETGKNCCTLFNRRMEELLFRNSLILEVLRNCIINNEVYLVYQPQINLKENRIVGFEALMRIYNSKLGLISPADFIPIAEDSGLIFELGAWAIKEACLLNKKLLDSGITPCTVSVNISPVQINHFDFFNTLSDILLETGLPPKYLELELTESALVNSLIDTATLIKKLQDIGVKIALDDFGTGYSSLSYLAKMSINTLKIDKSFIDNICGIEKELSMVHTIIRLAHHLGIQVVAEGVEHQSQLVLLKEKKCDTIQGFVYSKPLITEELTNLLRQTKVVSN